MNVPYPESVITKIPVHRTATPPPADAVTDGVTNLINSGQAELLAAAMKFYPHLVDHLDINGRSWLHQAAEVGTWGCAEALIQAGLDVNFRDIMDETPLHRAMFRHRADSVRFLLSAGADPNAASRFGVTPVHLASAWSNEMLAEAISAGGDLTVVDRYGKGIKEWSEWGAREAQRQAEILADSTSALPSGSTPADAFIMSTDEISRLARQRKEIVLPPTQPHSSGPRM